MVGASSQDIKLKGKFEIVGGASAPQEDKPAPKAR
jgi:hypothetical protein